MSTKTFDAKAFDGGLDFVPAPKQRTGSIWNTLALSLAAIREGIELAGEYKELTNRGMASDAAARKVFERIGKD